jgi:hypothetical protein
LNSIFLSELQVIVDAWADEDINATLSAKARSGTLPQGKTTKKTQAVGYTPMVVSALRQVDHTTKTKVNAFQSYNPSVEDYKVRASCESIIGIYIVYK